ncbi:PCP reductase family protein [Cyanobium sp. ULC082]
MRQSAAQWNGLVPLRSETMDWTEAAEQKLKEVPFFVRPAVRRRIEGLAAEAGISSIDPAFYAEARARFARK